MKKAFLSPLLSVGITLLWTALVLFGLSYVDVRLLTVYPPLITALIGLGALLFLFVLDILYQLLLKLYRSRLRRFLLPRA